MQYVPYGRLLTIDQANAVHMAAEAKEKKVKTWLKIQAIAWLIGLIALLKICINVKGYNI